MGETPESKRAALIARLALFPVRPSGPVTFHTVAELTENRDLTPEEARLALPLCYECYQPVIVGSEGLIKGRYCARCAHSLGIIVYPPTDLLPPAA